MVVTFQYVPEDFAEVVQATSAAKAGRLPGSHRPNGRRLARGLLGWVMFFSMLLLIWWFGRSPDHAARQPFTHNYLQTLLSSLISPSFTLALIAAGMSIDFGIGAVPFYAPKTSLPKLPRIVAAIIAILATVGCVLTICAMFRLPIEPDWRPSPGQFVALLIGPWFAWLIIVMGLYSLRQLHPAFQNPRAKLFFAEGNSLHEPRNLEANAEGLTFSTKFFSERLNWPFITSYVESRNLICMYTRDLSTYVIPKRAFTDPESFQRFCGLLQNQVSSGMFLPRPSGFAVVNPVPAAAMESPAGSAEEKRV